MPIAADTQLIAFDGTRRLVAGDAAAVLVATRAAEQHGAPGPILLFNRETGEQLDFDLRGPVEEVLARLAPPDAAPEAPPAGPRGPGRPKLGVVAREVTLLPKHWAWLATQRGGASIALRRLVDQASRASEGADRTRRRREAGYRFMSAMAGNFPGFEEAMRAYFAGDVAAFGAHSAEWPVDVREEAGRYVVE